MFVCFPNQLYEDVSNLPTTPNKVYLVEEPMYFYDASLRPFRYHRAKLAYMVACMRAYMSHLKAHGIKARYVTYNEVPTFYKALKKATSVSMYDPTDTELVQKYRRLIPSRTPLNILPSPNFIMSPQDLDAFNAAHPRGTKNAFFYTFAKNQLNILPNTPSLDHENRLPLPRTFDPSTIPPSPTYKSPHYAAALTYISTHPAFRTNPGTLSLPTLRQWPITHTDARTHLRAFLAHRFRSFGPYEDAIHSTHPYLYHATISAPLNMGLLDPRYVLHAALQHPDIPMNSREGFVRQVLGWREYMRYLYTHVLSPSGPPSPPTPAQTPPTSQPIKPDPYHLRRIRDWTPWLTGTTGIHPLDNEIKKALHTTSGYSHHIVRLMVFLNIFTLLRIHPDDIYRWFMEVVALDAFPWVMRSNIYAMGNAYPHPLAKPNISTSAYILRMSDYPRGPWAATWDAMFYTYLAGHPSPPHPYTRNLAYFRRLPATTRDTLLTTGKKALARYTRA